MRNNGFTTSVVEDRSGQGSKQGAAASFGWGALGGFGTSIALSLIGGLGFMTTFGVGFLVTAGLLAGSASIGMALLAGGLSAFAIAAGTAYAMYRIAKAGVKAVSDSKTLDKQWTAAGAATGLLGPSILDMILGGEMDMDFDAGDGDEGPAMKETEMEECESCIPQDGPDGRDLGNPFSTAGRPDAPDIVNAVEMPPPLPAPGPWDPGRKLNI